ncbi:MAG: carbamoyltransferase HypF, partial [Acidobacteriota bacterium]
ELKDTISVYKNGYIITSQFLGDLDEYQNYRYFEETVAHLCLLFDVRPEVVVSDLHPHFRTTRWAERSGLPHLRVQHHFAHVLAVLLEHKIPCGEAVLGVALDGYGYGADGGAWGGEFLLADYSSFTRVASFRPVPLPGGDLAAREPWRMGLSYLCDAFGLPLPKVKAFEKVDPKKLKAVLGMIQHGVNSPPTSSCGRLFDAVSFMAGEAPVQVEFEAEAPMRLEVLSRKRTSRVYPFFLTTDAKPWELSFVETIRSIVGDVEAKVGAERIGSAFHRTLAEAMTAVAVRIKKEYGIRKVVLVGGVFLNRVLLALTTEALERRGFGVFRPVRYSPNDESISLGQIAYALARLKKEKPG